MTFSTEQGFPYWLALGTILHGWALAEQGQAKEGLAQMRQGLVAWQAAGTELVRPWYLSLLAEVYGKVGQAKAGLSLLAEALALVDKTGERWQEAELYRLKGELLLNASREGRRPVLSAVEGSAVEGTVEGMKDELGDSSPEACFRQAIDIARGQRAKSLELRAVMSLCRLWQWQGKRDKARQMLAEIYDWFTEGFGTPDLQEAKALLEALA